MKFPKQIFVKTEEEGTDNEYFNVHRKVDTTVDAGESAKIGVYELREVVTATGSVTTVSMEKSR